MAVERIAGGTLADAFDRVLDKGVVIDARVSVASIDTVMPKRTRNAPHVAPALAVSEGRTGAPRIAGPRVHAENAARTVEAALRAWNAHDPRRYAALLDESYVGETHGVPRQLRGRHAARWAMRMKLKLFPDLRFDIQDVITKGQEALVSWVATGTRGNEPVHVSGCTVGGVRHGKIVHTWCYWDRDDLLAPLRVMARRPSDGQPIVHRLETAP